MKRAQGNPAPLGAKHSPDGDRAVLGSHAGPGRGPNASSCFPCAGSWGARCWAVPTLLGSGLQLSWVWGRGRGLSPSHPILPAPSCTRQGRGYSREQQRDLPSSVLPSSSRIQERAVGMQPVPEVPKRLLVMCSQARPAPVTATAPGWRKGTAHCSRDSPSPTPRVPPRVSDLGAEPPTALTPQTPTTTEPIPPTPGLISPHRSQLPPPRGSHAAAGGGGGGGGLAAMKKWLSPVTPRVLLGDGGQLGKG